MILFDGFSKKNAPGSLWSPSPTDLGIQGVPKLGLAFGLFMAGVGVMYQRLLTILKYFQFSGHAVIPSLARDMVDPSQFDHMINRAFVSSRVTLGVSFLIVSEDCCDMPLHCHRICWVSHVWSKCQR